MDVSRLLSCGDGENNQHRGLLHREPFKSFLLRLYNGKDIKVEHPELVLFTPSKAKAVVVEGEHVHVIAVEHISALSH